MVTGLRSPGCGDGVARSPGRGDGVALGERHAVFGSLVFPQVRDSRKLHVADFTGKWLLACIGHEKRQLRDYSSPALLGEGSDGGSIDSQCDLAMCMCLKHLPV